MRRKTCDTTLVTLSLADVLKREVADLSRQHVYEISSQSPLARCLRRHARYTRFSEPPPLGAYCCAASAVIFVPTPAFVKISSNSAWGTVPSMI